MTPGGWAVRDLRPDGQMHVVPCDEVGVPLATHEPRADCQCQPKAVRETPLDEPVISHHEPGHPGAIDEWLDA